MPISPEEFAQGMRSIDQTIRDQEQSHIESDAFMCELLISMGYKKGVEIFREMPNGIHKGGFIW
jgi:hypothetical protein